VSDLALFDYARMQAGAPVTLKFVDGKARTLSPVTLLP
jgi:hypothetical protein